MPDMTVNMNWDVRVKLTPHGMDCYIRHWQKYGIKHDLPKLDADGHYKTQLWCLMQEFGEFIGNGMTPVFESTDLVISPFAS